MMGKGEGAEYKCRPPWLAEDEKLKKNHWLKHLKAVPQKTKFGPRNTAKTPSDPFFINLSENMFLSGVRIKICTAPFLDVEDAVSGCQETVQCNTFSETETRFLEANVCIFLYISAGKFLFQRCSKILPGGGKLRVG